MRMKKLFLLVATVLTIGQAMATVWFVRSDIAETSGNGDTWEGALCPADFLQVVNGGLADAGDVFYISGGNYLFSQSISVSKGLSFYGGYPLGLTGTNVPEIKYPSTTPTTFTGDINENDQPDAGDLAHMFVVNTADKVVINGINVTCCYYDIEGYGAGAITIDGCNDATLSNAEVYNNKSIDCGGAGLTQTGGKLYICDCYFHNNSAKTKGGAVLLQQLTKQDESKEDPILVVERSSFCYNTLDTESSDGLYGAAIQIRQGYLWAANTTIAKNTAYANGAGISISEPYSAHLISCTLADNQCSRILYDASKPYAYGASIRMRKNAKLWFANCVMLEGTQDVGNKTCPTVYTESLTGINIDTCFYSGNYNYLGTFNNGEKNNNDSVWAFCWKANDMFTVPSSVRRYADYFGTNAPTVDGGVGATIKPTSEVAGAPLTTLNALATAWGFPVAVDLSVDQRGYARQSTSMRGAYDLQAEKPTYLYQISAPTQSSKMMVNGQLLIERNGVYYNNLGTIVK